MIERKGDIFRLNFLDYWNIKDVPHGSGILKCITTNGVIKKNGALVMGAGVAKQAAEFYPHLPFYFARKVKEDGNNVYVDYQTNFASFPTKHHWRQKSDIDLIKRSAEQLKELSIWYEAIFMTRPGCGNGGLNWSVVKHHITPILDEDKFIVLYL